MGERMPFTFHDEARAIMAAVSGEVATRLWHLRGKYINPENVQRFRHGALWQSHNSHSPDERTTMTKHSHGVSIRFEDILVGRESAVKDCVASLVAAMQDSYLKSLFNKVSETCEESGNVVAAKGDLRSAIIEMLEKVEFGVGRDGTVSMPQLHTGIEMYERLKTEPSLRGPDFVERINKIKERKAKLALIKESERRAKFAGVSEL